MTQSDYPRANTLKSAFKACDLAPLEPAEMERYYVDLSPVRKSSAAIPWNLRLKPVT